MKTIVIKTLDVVGREVYLTSESILYAVKSLGDDFRVHGKTIEEATEIIDDYDSLARTASALVEDRLDEELVVDEAPPG